MRKGGFSASESTPSSHRIKSALLLCPPVAVYCCSDRLSNKWRRKRTATQNISLLTPTLGWARRHRQPLNYTQRRRRQSLISSQHIVRSSVVLHHMCSMNGRGDGVNDVGRRRCALIGVMNQVERRGLHH